MKHHRHRPAADDHGGSTGERRAANTLGASGDSLLRVHFNAGDLARTRVADGPDPLWESVLSLHQLQERNQKRDQKRDREAAALDDWRRHVLRHSGPSLRLLLPLVPARGYFPDFLTPAAGAAGFEAGLDALLSTPRGQLRNQMEKLNIQQPQPPCQWARSVAEGSAPALRRLGASLRDYRRVALGTSWQRVRSGTEADRTWRARVHWYGGTEALLRTFGPRMRWKPPVLECDYPIESDMRLRGRGLLLIPSYFCRGTPVALADPSLPPTLVYPARAPERPGTITGERLGGGGADGGGGDAAARAHLARLLGHTRAAVLLSVGGDCTTSELALRSGVSVSSASEHAAVLRDAGLITSSRDRNAVRHALTPVGLALLERLGTSLVPASLVPASFVPASFVPGSGMPTAGTDAKAAVSRAVDVAAATEA